MPPVGFEPTISVTERPQTYALDCAATRTGPDTTTYVKITFAVIFLAFTGDIFSLSG